MTLIAKIIATAAVFHLIKTILYPMFRPVSTRQKKRTRAYLKDKKSMEFKERIKRVKREFAMKYVKSLINEAERSRLKKMIDRLDLPVRPEEIRTDQLMYTAIGILATVIMFSANRLFGCVTAAFIILGWLYPVEEMEKTIEKKNKNVSLDFPSFYSMVYYQYSKSVNIFFADVIKDYLPNANPDMAEELGVMLDNIEYGEEFALKQLKKRVPIHYIIKFCDIMETRLRGYDNIAQMAYLKNELDNYRIIMLEEELERRQKGNARIQIALIVILFLYITIYFVFMIISALEMFQF